MFLAIGYRSVSGKPAALEMIEYESDELFGEMGLDARSRGSREAHRICASNQVTA